MLLYLVFELDNYKLAKSICKHGRAKITPPCLDLLITSGTMKVHAYHGKAWTMGKNAWIKHAYNGSMILCAHPKSTDKVSVVSGFCLQIQNRVLETYGLHAWSLKILAHFSFYIDKEGRPRIAHIAFTLMKIPIAWKLENSHIPHGNISTWNCTMLADIPQVSSETRPSPFRETRHLLPQLYILIH